MWLAALSTRAADNTPAYLQFSVAGRYVLAANGATAEAQHIDDAETTPATTKWTLEASTAEASCHVLKTADGQWLKATAEGAFTLTADEAEATPLDKADNQYCLADGLVRLCLTLHTDATKALGVKDGKLVWVKPGSRWSVVYMGAKVMGLDFPQVSTDSRQVWYKMEGYYGGENTINYLYAAGSRMTCASVAASVPSNLTATNSQWALYEANDMGDVYMVNRDGNYMRQGGTDNKYVYTAKKAQASVIRLYEYVDGGAVKFAYESTPAAATETRTWDNFWQMKNTAATGHFAYLGWQSNVGSNFPNSYTDKGKFGFSSNRIRFSMADIEGDTYLQFSMAGHYVLSQSGSEATIEHIDLNDTAERNKWSLEADGSSYRLKSATGTYLCATAEGEFSIVSDAASATLFDTADNDYCKAEGITSRLCLTLHADATKALGLYKGKLAWVKPHSRWSVIRLTGMVKGPDFPEPTTSMSESRYSMNIYYGGETFSSLIYADANANPNLTAAAENKAMPATYTTEGSSWMAYDANDMGDVILANAKGMYLAQDATTGVYTYTTSIKEAARMRLFEHADGGTVTYTESGTKKSAGGQDWQDFWQMKNVSGTYLYIGWDGKLGGSGSNNNMKDNFTGRNSIDFAFNRLQFRLRQSGTGVAGYLQFSGMGRYVMSEGTNGGIEVNEIDATDAAPAESYNWTLEALADGNYALHNGAGHYLTVSVSADGTATFGTTTNNSQATPLTVSINQYYTAQLLRRFNLALASDPTRALGVDNMGRFGLVQSHTRWSVVRVAQNVAGADHVRLSDSSNESIYNLGWLYEQNSTQFTTNYALAQSPSTLTCSENAFTRLSQNYQWQLVATADGSGDFNLRSVSGYYVQQSAAADICTITDDQSKAARLQLVESDDMGSKFATTWQIRNADTGGFLFIGWESKIGGTGNPITLKYDGIAKGEYNYSNNRMVFAPVEFENRGYLLFSAMGPYPLVELQGGNAAGGATTGGEDDMDNTGVAGGTAESDLRAIDGFTQGGTLNKGAMWSLCKDSNSEYYLLKNDNGHYAAYTEGDSQTGAHFYCTASEADAYRFTRFTSTYQNNESARYELGSTDGTKALIANMGAKSQLDGTLSWGEHGTRYAVLRFTDFVTGPVLPEVNAASTSMKVYRIYTTSRNFDHYQLLNSGTGESNLTAQVLPNEDYDRASAEDDNQHGLGTLWVASAVETGQRGYIGDCLMQSYRGQYLGYNQQTKRMVLTADKTKAAVIRLVESDATADAWQVELIGGYDADGNYTDYNLGKADIMKLVARATTGDVYFTLGSCNDQYALLQVDAANVYPDIYGTNEGAMRNLQFALVDGEPYISIQGEANTVTGNGTEQLGYDTNLRLVRSSASASTSERYQDFVVVNASGVYWAYDKDTGAFTTTTKETEAARFALMQNYQKTGDNMAWCFCLRSAYNGTMLPANAADVMCVVRHDDGSLGLTPYVEHYNDPLTAIYFGSRNSPFFASNDHYYFNYIKLPAISTDDTPLYLTGSVEGSPIVHAETKAINQINPSAKKVEFLNNQLWAFVGTNNDFVIMSRDKVWLAWNQDDSVAIRNDLAIEESFVGVTDEARAAHFAMFCTQTDSTYVIKYIRGVDNQLGVGKYLQILEGNAWDKNEGKTTSHYLGLVDDAVSAFKPERWTVSEAEDYTGFSIRHKRSWFVREAQDITDEPLTGFVSKHNTTGYKTHPQTEGDIQDANTFETHLYLKDGTHRYLFLPSMLRINNNVGASTLRAYQRFYNYDTDGALDPYRVILKRKSRREYSNGTVMGAYLNLNSYFGAFVGEEITFQMPPVSATDYRYAVGIDASVYTDFVDYFGDNALTYEDSLRNNMGIVVPQHQDLIEPTLSGRYIYVIHNAREVAEDLLINYRADLTEKFYENHEMHFPKKKVSFKNCTVGLDRQFQDYWFYDTNMRYDSHMTWEEYNAMLVNIKDYDHIQFEVEGNAGIKLYYPDGTTAPDAQPVDDAPYKYSDISERRFIRFLYPKANADGSPIAGTTELALPTEVGCALGDSAIIKVYAYSPECGARYNLARFVLHFDDGTEPLPYNEVLGYTNRAAEMAAAEGLDVVNTATDDDTDTNNGTLLRTNARVATMFRSTRSPQALEAAYGKARATIDFNAVTFKPFRTPPFGYSTIDKHTSNNFGSADGPRQPGTIVYNSYGIPLLYDHTSYDFQPYMYDASQYKTYENPWGSYTISKAMKATWLSSKQNIYHAVRSLYKSAYPKGGYDDTNAAFMYIDASELPGSICSLQFDGSLCRGSRLYFSAWLSSPDALSDTPGNLVFTVKGVKLDPTTQQKVSERVLYNYCPGPIFDVARTADGGTLQHGQNEEGIWQQVYFSFVNNMDESYDRYELAVDNACTNSSGGDIMIDEVQMFAMKPTVSMERTTPVCGQQLTLAKLTCDYDGMMNALGLEAGETPATGMPSMWYCLYDKEIYDQALAGISRPTQAQVKAAFDAALVGDPKATSGTEQAFRHVSFSTTYESIPEFSYKESLSPSTNEAIIRRETDAKGEKHLIISDKVSSAKLKGRHQYYLAFVPRYGNSPITASNAVTEFQIGDSCCIVSVFETAGSASFLENGTDSTTNGNVITACANQSINITAQLNGTGYDGQQITMQPMYDWWLDYVACPVDEAYITADGQFTTHTKAEEAANGEVTLREALTNLRHHYPTAATLDGLAAVPDDRDFALTEAMLKGLQQLTLPVPDTTDGEGNTTKGHEAPLHLYSQALNITLPEPPEGTLADAYSVMTLLPIEVNNDTIIYCFDPQQVKVSLMGKAPTMMAGFRQLDAQYPDHLREASLRVEQEVVEAVKTDYYRNLPQQMLRIPLRGIKVISEGAAIGLKIDPRDSIDYAPVYLVGTNDAAMRVYDGDSTAENFRAVGRVYALTANRTASEDAYADIFLFDSFKPREGYTYALRLNFEEQFAEGHVKTTEEQGVCEGSLIVNMAIVPRYMVWTGKAGNADWSNDLNWARADSTDLNCPKSYTANSTLGNAQGFVPLVHTNVLIADKAAVQPALYEVANNGNASAIISFDTPGAPAQRTAMADIEYAIVADGTALESSTMGGSQMPYLKCMPFYTYKVHDLVVQAGAELARTDLLTGYNGAWVEYALKTGRWYTLGSPMQRMFAGDWYAPTATGRETAPYFEAQTFNPATNDRYAPAVYQRGWDKGKAALYYLPSDGAADTKLMNVALRADWSAVYNDVQEQYAGSGFSLKVAPSGKGGTTYADGVLFRLPKADTAFDYYNYDGTTATGLQAVNRTNTAQDGSTTDLTARLLTDGMTADAPLTLTLANRAEGNRLFLVGNPFVCGLDMRQFFAANTDVLGTEGWQYWLLTDLGQTAVMRGTNSEGWIAVNGNSADAEGIVARGQGFFVEAQANAMTTTNEGAQISLKFTPGMMVPATAANVALKAPQRRSMAANVQQGGSAAAPMLRITATAGALRSEAIIIKDTTATIHYDARHDMPALLDATLDAAPTLYSLADSAAVSINRRPTMQRVPLGISTTNTNMPVVLTFSGLDQFDEALSLLDAATGHVTPLTMAADSAAMSVSIAPAQAGRYFLLTSATDAPAKPDDATTHATPLITANGCRVSITTNGEPLTFVHVCDTAGRTLYRFTPYTPTTAFGLPAGAYIITARTAKAHTTQKVLMR